jgi:hypothetical protein
MPHEVLTDTLCCSGLQSTLRGTGLPHLCLAAQLLCSVLHSTMCYQFFSKSFSRFSGQIRGEKSVQLQNFRNSVLQELFFSDRWKPRREKLPLPELLSHRQIRLNSSQSSNVGRSLKIGYSRDMRPRFRPVGNIAGTEFKFRKKSSPIRSMKTSFVKRDRRVYFSRESQFIIWILWRRD